MELVLIFDSSHFAMRAFKIIEKSSIKGEIIPTPREISSECGFALLIENQSKQELIDFCYENKLNQTDIYTKEGNVYENN